MGSVEQWTAHFRAMANNELPPESRLVVGRRGGGPVKTYYKVKAVQQPPLVRPVQQVVEVQQPPIVSPVQQVVEQAEAKVNHKMTLKKKKSKTKTASIYTKTKRREASN